MSTRFGISASPASSASTWRSTTTCAAAWWSRSGCSSNYGPAWRSRFVNLYVVTPENAVLMYWPDQPWALNASDWEVHGKLALIAGSQDEVLVLGEARPAPAGGQQWSDLYFDYGVNDWLVSATEPVISDGRHLLSVGQDILLHELIERTLRSDLEGTYNLIFRADGRLIAHPRYMEAIQAQSGALAIQDAGDPHLERIFALAQERPADRGHRRQRGGRGVPRDHPAERPGLVSGHGVPARDRHRRRVRDRAADPGARRGRADPRDRDPVLGAAPAGGRAAQAPDRRDPAGGVRPLRRPARGRSRRRDRPAGALLQYHGRRARRARGEPERAQRPPGRGEPAAGARARGARAHRAGDRAPARGPASEREAQCARLAARGRGARAQQPALGRGRPLDPARGGPEGHARSRRDRQGARRGRALRADRQDLPRDGAAAGALAPAGPASRT